MSETIVLGGGCFWCLEAAYQLIEGVEKVVPGYAGGTTDNPTYWDLHEAGNDHAEVVQVTFDTQKISLDDVLEIFWTIHDPTTPNQQGNDIGPEYRSIILFNNDAQKQVIEKSLQSAQKLWPNPIVTEVKTLTKFCEAEEEHHDYFNKNPNQAYCQVIINPKLAKLRAKFAAKMKQ